MSDLIRARDWPTESIPYRPTSTGCLYQCPNSGEGLGIGDYRSLHHLAKDLRSIQTMPVGLSLAGISTPIFFTSMEQLRCLYISEAFIIAQV